MVNGQSDRRRSVRGSPSSSPLQTFLQQPTSQRVADEKRPKILSGRNGGRAFLPEVREFFYGRRPHQLVRASCIVLAYGFAALVCIRIQQIPPLNLP